MAKVQKRKSAPKRIAFDVDSALYSRLLGAWSDDLRRAAQGEGVAQPTLASTIRRLLEAAL